MTGHDEPPQPPTETPAERRRRLAEVFGDVLPETTSDEREPARDTSGDGWLLEQRPPHHG